MIKILFLAANPKDTSLLRLGEEMRAIQEKLRLAKLRDEFAIEQEWAVRVTDLQGHLLRHQPHIVHFSGHGSRAGQIILEDHSGNSKPVSPEALKRLFSTLKDNIRCVVLNACYSAGQAEGISDSIDCVIGMTKAIGDQAAIAFAASFYQALGYGRSIQTAFDLGCGQIDLNGLGEEDTPKLGVASEVVAAEIHLAGKTPVVRTGIPESVTEPPSLVRKGTDLTVPNDPTQLQSCFISYSHKDEAFAQKLHARLRDEGVRVWYAPEDIQGGKKLHEQIGKAIQDQDRLLLVLSKHSMNSEWVKTEIRKSRQAEVRERKRRLFPIRLVGVEAIRDWECFDADIGKDSAAEIREYFIPDFSKWKDGVTFEASFSRLLKDLHFPQLHVYGLCIA